MGLITELGKTYSEARLRFNILDHEIDAFADFRLQNACFSGLGGCVYVQITSVLTR